MKARASLPAVLSLAVLSALASCSLGEDRPLEQRLQETLEKTFEKCDVRGTSAAVVFPDKSVWTGTAGISHDTVAMRPDMVFGIGSITKNVTAALALQLQEDGLLSLEDPLSEWLPAYPHVDSAITVRQLLNHTSGLYMFWDNEDIWEALKADRTKVWTPEEVLSYIKEPYFAPGERFRYSNTNYLLAAMIIEKATGSTLAAEFRKRFWQPLSLENAFVSVQEEYPDNLAHVYGDDREFGGRDEDVTFVPRASHESIIFGSGGVFMTAEELARWSHALFEGEVLSPAALEEMLQFVDFRPFANMRSYGLGVQKYTKEFCCGQEAIGHGGGNIGSGTYMLHLPEVRTSVVVMLNAYPSSCPDIITRGLTKTILRDAGVSCLIPRFEFFPKGLVLLIAAVYIALVTIHQIRRRRRAA